MAKKSEEEYVEAIGGHGKKDNQKLKPLLVLMYLMRRITLLPVKKSPDILLRMISGQREDPFILILIRSIRFFT